MKLVVPTPNFSVIMPGGCPGKCHFCFWKPGKPLGAQRYRDRLTEVCESLPERFQQVSVTGGEPTCNRHLKAYLTILRQRFKKIVLTTTGYDLRLHSLEGLVDHVNISRHHHNSASNKKIMGATHLSNAQLKGEIEQLNLDGIDVTLNCVLTNQLAKTLPHRPERRKFIESYIEIAKKLGASSVCFRVDANENTLQSNAFERLFVQHRVISKFDCPVCRSKTQLIRGMRVAWKSSLIEPKEQLSDEEIYELILHPNGRLTMDWAGKIQLPPSLELQAPDDELDDLVMALHGVEKTKTPPVKKKASPLPDNVIQEMHSFQVVSKPVIKATKKKKTPSPYNTSYSGCGPSNMGGC